MTYQAHDGVGIRTMYATERDRRWYPVCQFCGRTGVYPTNRGVPHRHKVPDRSGWCERGVDREGEGSAAAVAH